MVDSSASSSEGNPFRLGRTLEVVRAATLGVRLRRADSLDEEQRKRTRRALSQALGRMKGLSMKVGQLLVEGEDDELSSLVDGVQGMPLREARRVLEAELGSRAERVKLGELVHAASLGQVHRGHLVGEKHSLAIKIQYPDIAKNVAAELALSQLVPKLGPVARYGFDLSGYKRVLREGLLAELNYSSEAERQLAFRRAARIEGLIVPDIVENFCSKRVLCQQWVSGQRLQEAKSFERSARLRICRTLLMTLFDGLFQTGSVHGDPHRGNYKFRPTGEVVLYDFGCVIEINEVRRRALLALLLHLRENRPGSVLGYWVSLGFEEKKLAAIAPKLGSLSRVLFAPFLSEGAFEPATWRIGTRFEELLGDLRWWFRAAGPPDLFLVLRAFSGALSFLQEFDVRLPWWPLLQHVLDDSVVAAAHGWCPQELTEAPSFATVEFLRVELERDDAKPFSVTFPACEALQLSRLLPDGVVTPEQLEKVRSVEARLNEEGLRPGMLLQGTGLQGTFRIWLQ